MSTKKQIQANRPNALKSTGPKTEAGKAAVRLNPLRHGLLATDVVIAGESAKDFAELREQLFDCFHPLGWLEGNLVERLATLTWQLCRCVRVDSSIFTSEIEGNGLYGEGERPLAQAFVIRGDKLLTLARYQSHIERSYFQTTRELHRLQAPRASQQVPSHAAVQVTTNTKERPRPVESDPVSDEEFLPEKAA